VIGEAKEQKLPCMIMITTKEIVTNMAQKLVFAEERSADLCFLIDLSLCSFALLGKAVSEMPFIFLSLEESFPALLGGLGGFFQLGFRAGLPFSGLTFSQHTEMESAFTAFAKPISWDCLATTGTDESFTVL